MYTKKVGKYNKPLDNFRQKGKVECCSVMFMRAFADYLTVFCSTYR